MNDNLCYSRFMVGLECVKEMQRCVYGIREEEKGEFLRCEAPFVMCQMIWEAASRC